MSDSSRQYRLVVFLVLSAGVFGFVLSCQDRHSALKERSAPSTIPTTVASVEKEKPEEGAVDAKALGYAWPAAPTLSRTHSKDELKKISETISCTACHTGYGTYEHTMHDDTNGKQFIGITCVECHGGNSDVDVPRGIERTDKRFVALQKKAHVQPSHPEIWGHDPVNPELPGSRNPEIPGARPIHESADYIRFINPGDLLAAQVACASCHKDEVTRVRTDMMSTSPMLWGAALYNNGEYPRKLPHFGQAYDNHGTPLRVVASPPPTTQEVFQKGHLPELWPLLRWEISEPTNPLRVFERGGRSRPIIGIPDPEEDSGKPEDKLSIRGLGSDLRTSPVYLGLQKTRLLDPTLILMGTNDHAGDYRGSGCSACHVVYANDRSSVHAGKWAQFGNRGETQNPDPMIPKHESGHPIQHQFQRQMPSSNCIVCHIHPGTNVVNSYLGFLWWDNETDGQAMYPMHQHNPTAEQKFEVSQHNPEETAPRGLWSNIHPDAKNQLGQIAGKNFLDNVTDLNPELKHTQFADFHGHGWIFRAVYKQDRHGNMLDAAGNIVENPTSKQLGDAVAFTSDAAHPKPPAGSPVHLKDIHLERGMQCVDCHFSQDVHGDGNLYGETRAPVMVDCIDCHGTSEQPAAMLRYLTSSRQVQNSDEGKKLLIGTFTGNAADNGLSAVDQGARNKTIMTDHFVMKSGKLWQKSSMDDSKGWFVVQTTDTIAPKSWWTTDSNTSKDTAKLARFSHTVRRDGKTWGSAPDPDNKKTELELAHSNNNMTCYACHTSWTTACFGCHLPMRANARKEMLHNEATISRNYTNYNFQTLRDDVYMLGIDSTVKGHKVVPVRSSCAVLVGSEDAERQQLYFQQQTISAEGFAGTSFSVYFPHTVRATETKTCVDCHISKAGDNNAIMAQLLLQGTNSVNFTGRYQWVAEGKEGLQAVAVSAKTEPQSVFGSRLQEIAYPDDYKKFVSGGRKLDEHYEHEGTVLDVQNRGEYLYAACGEDGFIAYDINQIDNKGFSERIQTSPVSPLGQRFYVKSKYATSVCSPSTLAIDPTRQHFKENQEQSVHLLYACLYLTDREEGLIVIGNPLNTPKSKGGAGVATLLDNDPDNNFIQRALTYNPGGILHGARSMSLYGHYAYICCDAGIVIVNLDNPLAPKPVGIFNAPELSQARKIQFQFRYGFVIDGQGMKVIDVTDPEHPHLVPNADVDISNANDIYVSRTYAYIAAGKNGLAIVDVEKPEQPRLDQMYDADGKMNDARAVKVSMTNASMFAYVADGENGLKVLQLTSPDDTPKYLGFSPRPAPRLIAWYKTHGPALAVTEGLDRDRAVDESGHQLAVFGRLGARPFNLEEQQRLYLHNNGDGTKSLYTVSNKPGTQPLQPKEPEKPAAPAEEAPRRRFPGRK
jgi:hypothetical protein